MGISENINIAIIADTTGSQSFDAETNEGEKYFKHQLKILWPKMVEKSESRSPKDIEKNQCVIVRRDNREKIFVSLDNLSEEVQKALDAVHNAMYEKALKNMQEKTAVATNFEEFVDIAENKPGFIKAMWCGEKECEEKLKEVTNGVKSRCIPFDEEHLADTCVCCGKPAKHMVYWGKQY